MIIHQEQELVKGGLDNLIKCFEDRQNGGFRIIAIASDESEHLVLFEKSNVNQKFFRITGGFTPISKMVSELNTEGYRVVSFAVEDGDYILIAEESIATIELSEDPKVRYEQLSAFQAHSCMD